MLLRVVVVEEVDELGEEDMLLGGVVVEEVGGDTRHLGEWVLAAQEVLQEQLPLHPKLDEHVDEFDNGISKPLPNLPQERGVQLNNKTSKIREK